MRRISDLDISDRLLPFVPRWVTQFAVGALCAIGIGVIRAGLDMVAKGAAPFALVYPAIILATLFGRWMSGAVTAIISIIYAWFYIYGVAPNAAMAGNVPLLSVGVVSIGAVFTIVIADLFRAAARRATEERDREIADRDLFLEEFDHRVKNNFAIVVGILDMQKRRAVEPATIEALATAQMRVESIARAHRHLYRDGQPGTVEMRDYLGDLCAALAKALFPSGGISLTCNVADAAVPRDRAVSIGLVVNELVTNAAKHAFPGRADGTITVGFSVRPGGGWHVVVSDDGVGLPSTATSAKGGLGARLTEAFARQAGGKIVTESDRTGTRVMLDLAA